MSNMTATEMKHRAEVLLTEVFGGKPLVAIIGGVFNYCDESISINGSFCITKYDGGALPQSRVAPMGFQLSEIKIIPGVMYHKDGSGEPDSEELIDIGSLKSDFDDVMIMAVQEISKQRIQDFLEWECEAKNESYPDNYYENEP